VDKGPREGSVKGYATTLQYLWSTLLDPEEYVDSGVPNLTKCERYTPRDAWEREQSDSYPKDETALSSFRPQIKETIIDPLDARYPDDLTSFSLEAGDLLHWKGDPLKGTARLRLN
jgi:hypothetical protein